MGDDEDSVAATQEKLAELQADMDANIAAGVRKQMIFIKT